MSHFDIMGFHLNYNKAGLRTIEVNHQKIDQLIPASLEVKSDGKLLIKKLSQKLFNLFEKEEISPMIQNFELSSKVSNQLIKDQKAINNLINNLLSYFSSNNFCELCIDIEGVSYKNKKQFTDFISRLTSVFHQKGYTISIAIPAKSENNMDSTWSGAYDYKALGEIVDKIIIMAYDYHWVGGPPGPIAPIFWVQDVIDYSIIEIPLNKIYLALGFYGYDWTLNNDSKARGLVYNQIMNIVKSNNVDIEWDPDSQTPYFKYNLHGDKHEVWFENRASIEKKIKLLEEFNLKGVAFWRLGQEDSDVWKIL